MRLYSFVRGFAYSYQFSRLSEREKRSMTAMGLLKRSTWPFVCGYVDVKVFAMHSTRQVFYYSLLANCGPLSDNKSLGALYVKTQCDANPLATWTPVVHFSGTTCVSLVKGSAITKINRLPDFFFGNGPKRSIATDLSGCFAGETPLAASGGREVNGFGRSEDTTIL